MLLIAICRAFLDHLSMSLKGICGVLSFYTTKIGTAVAQQSFAKLVNTKWGCSMTINRSLLTLFIILLYVASIICKCQCNCVVVMPLWTYEKTQPSLTKIRWTYIHTHKHTYIHTYIHIYIHTYIQMQTGCTARL